MKNSDCKVQCSAFYKANFCYFAFYSPKRILLRLGWVCQESDSHCGGRVSDAYHSYVLYLPLL